MIQKFKVIATALAIVATTHVQAQSLPDAFKPAVWSSYIFVSTKMPQSSLIQLAREASQSRSTLILRGFDSDTRNLESSRQFVAEINRVCCGKNPPAWAIHPKFFDTFKVKHTPSFVLTKSDTPNSDDFALISGDMNLANALKFIAQSSTREETRSAAAVLYKKSFNNF